MSSTRIRKNLLGSVEPQSKPKEIRDILSSEYINYVDLHPIYQRDIKWQPDAMSDFIGTVMDNGLVPSIIMYQLQAEDIAANKGKYKYEAVDGKHRLTALHAFKTSAVQTSTLNKKKLYIVHWCYEETDEKGNKHVQRVFYQDTPEVHKWYNDTYRVGSPCFLNAEEKDAFDNYTVNITMIRSKLSLDQRREIFMSLQKGIPVRNSDYLKNMTVCKLIAKFNENGFETKMNIFYNRCSKKATNYKIHWGGRQFLLFGASLDSTIDPVEIFLKRDTAIKEAIETNDAVLNPTDEEFEAFDNKFNGFIEFLQGQEEGLIFNPTQMFALFYHLCSVGDDKKNIITSHMKHFSQDGIKKEYKSLWEGKSNHYQRKEYFNECLKVLEGMTEMYVATPIEPRKKIPMTIRKKVFEKAEVIGACDTCETKISLKTFEVGHILAHALGGKAELDNLIPLCKDCNKQMGTMHPTTFKAEKRPYIKL